MIFDWLAERRRRNILNDPFSAEWEAYLHKNMGHYDYLDTTEQKQLRDLTQVFIAEKDWEGCGGLELTDEIKVTIAAQACLLILGLDHILYKNVMTVLVYPSTVVPVYPAGYGDQHGIIQDEHCVPILGQAAMGGPIILVWDAVRRGGIHPEDGHNVVYHEFAHKLDMLDGEINGTPPLETRDQYKQWNEVCTREYKDLRRRAAAGKRTFLDQYGGKDVGEFFAVATEFFFDQPVRMEAEHNDLYEVLKGFYKQDPATRMRRQRK
ncbi:Protein MtfA [Poriferisphaera corsica]|uniref:Protein MtfA n=1 Tax=Poriferisphaera corsica TaxID=2528020 RepID=A0A517YYQ6_9BACT|nr:M90 family metallopeptidase [Poriferisphaera corsica]QDU35345.1 Protein MtfA [Poriferisphaera corsica]